jgi:diguanylate cyclase (GGDEF)-like protein/PAS domain S-box-containing protein
MSQERYADLRHKAEEQLAERKNRIEGLEQADLKNLAYELAVHQVELEIQNEELRQSRTQAEEARDRYLDLFDFAPIGYFTLDEHSRIVEANLKGCQMLKVNRSDLLKESFTEFINSEETDAFYFYRKKVLENSLQQTRDLTMLRSDGTSFSAQIEGVKAQAGRLRIAVIDITERKVAEEKLAEQAALLANVNRQNSIVSEMRELLQSCSAMQEMPPIITASVTRLFPNAGGALFLMNEFRTDLQSVARWGDFPEEVDENIFKPDACWGLRRGRVHVVADIKIGPICPHVKDPIPTPFMCLPLIAKGDILGLLHLRIKLSVQTEDRQKALFELKESAVIFAEYLALSIANIKLWEKLADQSVRDPLTGLFNRRYMEETIQREILRAARKKTKIGVVMADIDHLKKFNDTHGHEAGDKVLIQLADLFRSKIRGSDIACRYGGEEFILILPESSAEDTCKRAGYLREEVKNMKVYYHDQLLPSITLSMGIAAYPDHGIEMNELIHIADTALYRAKERGRDRVIMVDTPASF